MIKPHWETIADLADRFAAMGVGSSKDIKDLRGAAYQMELWFTTVQELREECEAARIKRFEQDAALQALSDVFFHAAKFARGEMTMDAFATGVRDKAGFKNIMATAYGRNSVGAPLPPKKTREVKEVSACI
jgi:hypothetical protein